MKGRNTMNYREFEECMEFCDCETMPERDSITICEGGSILAEIDTSLGYPEHVQFHVDNLRDYFRSQVNTEGERKHDWNIPAHQFVNMVFTFIFTNQESKYDPPLDCEEVEPFFDFDDMSPEDFLTDY